MLTFIRKHQLRKKLKQRILSQGPQEDLQIKDQIHTVLSNLEENQLENLLLALDTRGGNCESCVCLPQITPFLGGHLTNNNNIAMVLCKAFRWPDLVAATNLQKMPFCNSNHNLDCLNPYHYSKFLDVQYASTGLFPFSNPKIVEEENKNTAIFFEDEQMPSTCSTHINDENDEIPSPRSPYPVMTRSRSNVWCSLAYWEKRVRIGRLFNVNDSIVNVFDYLPKGDGLCLSAIKSECSESAKVRKRIGLGVTIAIDNQHDVWLFNRGDCAVFVHAPELEPEGARIQLINKLPPGHCLRIFNFVRASAKPKSKGRPLVPSTDGESVRLSFVKGWGGSKYKRQCITTCPCWMEILFNTGQFQYS